MRVKGSERRTEEHPNLIEDRKIPILERGQMARSRVGAELFTRKKRKKTGLMSTDNMRLRTNSLHVFLPVQAYSTYTTVSGL